MKNLPAMQETHIPSLGWKDPLETGMANPSSILAWRIPWTAEVARLWSIGLQRVAHNCSYLAHSHAQFIHLVEHYSKIQISMNLEIIMSEKKAIPCRYILYDFIYINY